MDERGTVETGSQDHVVSPGKDESRLMIVEGGDVERYDGKIGIFIIDGDTRDILQFADKSVGKIPVLPVNCLLTG
jgi:hypothetical protein